MSISRIKQIKQIVKDHPVTDPRGALAAIEQVLAQPKEPKDKGPTPILQLSLVRTNSAVLGCVIKTDPEQLQPKHVTVAIESLIEFGNEKYGQSECNDPECPVHGESAIQSATVSSEELKDLFDKITKGNLQ